MDDKKKIFELIKKRFETGESREKIISGLILEGYNFQEIQAALEEMKKRNELPPNFWIETQKGRKWSNFHFWGRYKKIEEELKEDNYSIERKSSNNFSKKWLWFFLLFLGIVGIASIVVWFFFFWESPLTILKRSLINLSKVNSFRFQSSFPLKISSFNTRQDDYLRSLFRNYSDKVDSFIKINLEGSVNVFDTSSVKRAFWIKFFDDKEKNIWRADFIQINPSEFYLLANFYLDIEKEKVFPLSRGYWLNLAASSSSSAYKQFISENIFRKSLSFYSFNNSNSIFNLREVLMNFSFSKSDFRFFKKVSSKGYFYRILAFPQSELNSRIFSVLDGLISFGGWFDKNQLIDAKWELWIGKNDFLPYQINIFLDQTDNPTIQIRLEKFNFPFDVNRPASSFLPEEMLEIIQDN